MGRGWFYYRPLLWLALAIGLGIKLAVYWNWSGWICLAGLLGLLVATYLLLPRWTAGASLTAWLAALLFGSYLANSSRPPATDGIAQLATRTAQPIALRGMLTTTAVWKPNPQYRASDPNSSEWLTSWVFACSEVRDENRWLSAPARCTLTVAGRVDDLLPGDELEVMGSLRRIWPPTNPGAFDFAEHLRQLGQFVSLRAEDRQQLKLLKRTWHLPVERCRGWLVQQVDENLSRWVTRGCKPLAAALVFGQREQVDWEDQQQLMATGTLHMLAISGMHVEIVAATLLLITAPLGWRNSTLLCLLIVVCGTYAILAGAKPPVMRAVIIVATFALARTLGRPARLSNALGLAAVVLMVAHPPNLDNVGVQLSFLAVATIGIFMVDQRPTTGGRSAVQRAIEESLGPGQRWGRQFARSLKQSSQMSLWVWLVTLPLIWNHFHIVSLIAIPLNVAVALPLSVGLTSGLACGVLGWLAPVGWLTGLLCSASLNCILWLIELGDQLPGGHWWLPAPPLWWSCSYYGLLVAWLLIFRLSRNGWLLALLAAWLAFALLPQCLDVNPARDSWLVPRAGSNQTPISRPALCCTFLDVGHGTSVIIEFPNGQVWLYDAGHLGAAERSHQDIAAALWQLPTYRLGKLFISHADADHYNASLGLAERFRIQSMESTPQFWNSSDRDVQALLRALPAGIDRVSRTAGDQGSEGEVHYRVLHPSSSEFAESDNASSLCLLLEYAGQRVLLPGDLEGSGLRALTQLPPRPCHVLMAPHHGSLTLDPRELLTWCRPEWTIISGNQRAARPEVIHKYQFETSQLETSQLAITFRDGAVQTRIDAKGQLHVFHWRDGDWQPLKPEPLPPAALP